MLLMNWFGLYKTCRQFRFRCIILGMMTTRFFYLTLLILTACNLAPANTSSTWPTATSVRATFSAPVPTTDRELHLVASPQPSETAIATTCGTPSTASNLHYTVVTDINYAKHQVSVVQNVHYKNSSLTDLAELVFIVEPNRWPGAFTLESVQVAGEGSAYDLTGRRLTVELAAPLAPECSLEVALKFRLEMPPIEDGLNAYHGYFGYSPRQLNLGHWLPTVAARSADAWVMHDAVFIGEQNVLQVADWDVTVNVVEAASSLEVAGPGTVTRINDKMWRFQLANARDFTLSMSEQFSLSQQQTDSGIVVELYSFADALVQTDSGAVLDAAARSLDEATRSVAMYEDLFGSYPFGRMVVVQGDFPDGMEFSGLVFVSGDWFQRYDGTPTGYLVVITVHEVAHQWWYARVGNDAALYPWLDEALATYSEYIFIEEYFPELKDWWWQWRVDRLSPQGFVDGNVYQFSTIREYINAVYLRGVRMLHEVRQALGTDEFFTLLRQYAQAGTGQLVTPDLFWSLLTPEQWEATRTIRERYFQRQDLLVGENP